MGTGSKNKTMSHKHHTVRRHHGSLKSCKRKMGEQITLRFWQAGGSKLKIREASLTAAALWCHKPKCDATSVDSWLARPPCNHHLLTSRVAVAAASAAVQLRHHIHILKRSDGYESERKKKKKNGRDKKVEALAHEINCPNYNKVWLLVSVHGRQFIFITIS